MIPVRIIGFRAISALNESLNYEQSREAERLVGGKLHHRGIQFSDHLFPSEGSDEHTQEIESRKKSGYAHTGIHDPQFTTVVPFGGLPKPDKYDEIIDLLKKDGYTEINYTKNNARNPETKRETKIGKFIGRKGLEELQKTHTDNISKINDGRMVPPPDPEVEEQHNKIKDNYHVRVTRHPHEVYGMSADDHPWAAAWGYDDYGPDVAEHHRNGGDDEDDRYTVYEDDSPGWGHVHDHNNQRIGDDTYDDDDWQDAAREHAQNKWSVEEQESEPDEDGDTTTHYHIPGHPELADEKYDDESEAIDAIHDWADNEYTHEPAIVYRVFDHHNNEYGDDHYEDEDDAQSEADDQNAEYRENNDEGIIQGGGQDGSCLSITGGCNSSYLRGEVEGGTHVAYLHHKGDKNFDQPLARIAIRPYQSQKSDHKIIRPSHSPSGFAHNFDMSSHREEALDHDVHTSDEHPEAFGSSEIDEITPTMLATMKTWSKKNFPTESGAHVYRMVSGAYHDPDGYGGGVPAKLTRDWFDKQTDEDKRDVLTRNANSLPSSFVKSLVRSPDADIASLALNFQGHHIKLDKPTMDSLRSFTGEDKSKIDVAIAAHLRDYGNEKANYAGVTKEDIEGLVNSKNPLMTLALTSKGKASSSYDIHGDPKVNPGSLMPEEEEEALAREQKADIAHDNATRPVIGQAPAVMQYRHVSARPLSDMGGYSNNGALRDFNSQIKEKHTEMAEKHPSLIGSSAYGYHGGFLKANPKYASHVIQNHNILTAEHLQQVSSSLDGRDMADLLTGKVTVKVGGEVVDPEAAHRFVPGGNLAKLLPAFPHLDQSTLDRLATHSNLYVHNGFGDIYDPDIIDQIGKLSAVDKSGILTSQFSKDREKCINNGHRNSKVTAEQMQRYVKEDLDHYKNLKVGDLDTAAASLGSIRVPSYASEEDLDDFYAAHAAHIANVADKYPEEVREDGSKGQYNMFSEYNKNSITSSTTGSLGSYMFHNGHIDTVAKLLTPVYLNSIAAKQSAKSEKATAEILDHMSSNPDVWSKSKEGVGAMLTMHNDQQNQALSKIIKAGHTNPLVVKTAMSSSDPEVTSSIVSHAPSSTLAHHLRHNMNWRSPSPSQLSMLRELNSRSKDQDDGSDWHTKLMDTAKSQDIDKVDPEIKKIVGNPNPHHVENSSSSLMSKYAGGEPVLGSNYLKRLMDTPISKDDQRKHEAAIEAISRLPEDQKKDAVNYVRSLPHHADNIKNWNRSYPSYSDQFATNHDFKKLIDEGHYDDQPHKLLSDASVGDNPDKVASLMHLHSRISGKNDSAANAIAAHAHENVIGSDYSSRIHWPSDSASSRWLHGIAVETAKTSPDMSNPARLLSNPHLDKSMATQIGGLMSSYQPNDTGQKDQAISASGAPNQLENAYFPKTPHGWDVFMDRSSDEMKRYAMRSHLKGADDSHIGSLVDHAVNGPADTLGVDAAHLAPHMNSAHTSKMADALIKDGRSFAPLANMLTDNVKASGKTRDKIVEHFKNSSEDHLGAMTSSLNKHADDIGVEHMQPLLQHLDAKHPRVNADMAKLAFASKAGPEHADTISKISRGYGGYGTNQVLQNYLKHPDQHGEKIENLKALSAAAPHRIPDDIHIPRSMMSSHIDNLHKAADHMQANIDDPINGRELADLKDGFTRSAAVNSASGPKHADRLYDMAHKMDVPIPSKLMDHISGNKLVDHAQHNDMVSYHNVAAFKSAINNNPSIKPSHMADIIRHVTNNTNNYDAAIHTLTLAMKHSPQSLVEPLVKHIKDSAPEVADQHMRGLLNNVHDAPKSAIDHVLSTSKDAHASTVIKLITNPNVTPGHFHTMMKDDRASAVGLAAMHPTLADDPGVRKAMQLHNPALVREEMRGKSFRNEHVAHALGINPDVSVGNIHYSDTPHASVAFLRGMVDRPVEDKAEHARTLVDLATNGIPTSHKASPIFKDGVNKHVAPYVLKHAPSDVFTHALAQEHSPVVNAHSLTQHVDLIANKVHPLNFLHPDTVAKNVAKVREGSRSAIELANKVGVKPEDLTAHVKEHVTPYAEHKNHINKLPSGSLVHLKTPGDTEHSAILSNPYHTSEHLDSAVNHLISSDEPTSGGALARAITSNKFTPAHADKLIASKHTGARFHEQLASHMPMNDAQWDALSSKADASNHRISHSSLMQNPSTPTHRLAAARVTSIHPSHPSWGDRSFVRDQVRQSMPYNVSKSAVLAAHPHMAGNLPGR